MTSPYTWTRTVLTPVQRAARVVGIVFVTMGVLGFVPGPTTAVEAMTFWSHHSPALLFGVFQTSVLHNLVHLSFGVVGYLASRSPSAAATYLVCGGAAYLLLFFYGLIVGTESPANVVPLNTADDVLHAVLGVTMIALAGAFGRRSQEAAAAEAPAEA